jgi:hypothetical protein
MNYSEPKITIDLKEYNDLIEFKNSINEDQIQIAAKKVVSTIINNNGDLIRSIKELGDKGIIITINHTGKLTFNENDVTITFKK